LEPQTRERFLRSIINYLARCRQAHERASIAGAKRFLDAAPAAGRYARLRLTTAVAESAIWRLRNSQAGC